MYALSKATRTKTEGYRSSPHSMVHDTIPNNLFFTTNGPPESPWKYKKYINIYFIHTSRPNESWNGLDHFLKTIQTYDF